MRNKNSHEMPEKFGIYKKFAQIFPFLVSKKLIDTLTKSGKESQYQQFRLFLVDDKVNSLSLNNLPNLDCIEFFEDDNVFKVTVTKQK